MIPRVGLAFYGPGDDDLAAAAAEEPLISSGAEELSGVPPEGPPLPLPTVAPERGGAPVSEGFTLRRGMKI